MNTRYRIHRRWRKPDLVVLQIGEQVPVYERPPVSGGLGHMLPTSPPPRPGSQPTGYRTVYRDAKPEDFLDQETIRSMLTTERDAT